MTIALSDIPNLKTGAQLEQQQQRASEGSWTVEELAGRLVEVRSIGPSAALSLGTSLVLDAQLHNEPVAWVSATNGLVFPIDLARNGVDLEAFALIRMPEPKRAAAAADQLLRCGAFGLIVIDLGDDPWFPDALQNRLVRHAEEHHTAVVCLTEHSRNSRPLGSMVSLRGEVRRARTGDEFRCTLRAERDRGRRAGWSIEEVRIGTMGLR